MIFIIRKKKTKEKPEMTKNKNFVISKTYDNKYFLIKLHHQNNYFISILKLNIQICIKNEAKIVTVSEIIYTLKRKRNKACIRVKQKIKGKRETK